MKHDRRRLDAEWFWTDRWVNSRGFLLPLEPRGLYREMLTAAWRRGGSLPNDPEQIRRAIGVTEAEWARCWPLVKRFWRVDGTRLVNETQVAIYSETKERVEKASAHGRLGAAGRFGRADD